VLIVQEISLNSLGGTRGPDCPMRVDPAAAKPKRITKAKNEKNCPQNARRLPRHHRRVGCCRPNPAELIEQVCKTNIHFKQTLTTGEHKALYEILDKDVVVVSSTGKAVPRDYMIEAVRTGKARVTWKQNQGEEVHLHS